jgi:ferrous iron transport protein A
VRLRLKIQTMTTDQNNTAPQMRLGLAKRGYSGVIHHLDADEGSSSLPAIELESRLIELGFVEGARVEVLHEGIIGRDPIAVRIENVTVAVRRREAMAVVVV